MNKGDIIKCKTSEDLFEFIQILYSGNFENIDKNIRQLKIERILNV